MIEYHDDDEKSMIVDCCHDFVHFQSRSAEDGRDEVRITIVLTDEEIPALISQLSSWLMKREMVEE